MPTLQIGQHVLEFDECDAALVASRKWGIVKVKSNIYARTKQPGRKGKWIKLHQLLMPGCRRVDHKDGNGLNNRRTNLRPATHAQNIWNARKLQKATSRFKWVTRVRDRICSFEASVTANGKRLKLGRFHDEVAAALAADITALKLHGEFARPNFSIVEAALAYPNSLKIAIERCVRCGVIQGALAQAA